MSAKRFLRAAAVLLALLTMFSGCWKKNNNPTPGSSTSSGTGESGYDLVIYHSRDSLRAPLRILASAYETATGKKINFTYAENDLGGKIGTEKPALYLVSDYSTVTDLKTNMKDYSAGGAMAGVYTTMPAGLALDVSGKGSYGLPFEIEGRGYIVDPQMLGNLFPAADSAVLIADLQTCGYSEFKALVKAVAGWIKTPTAAKVLLDGHTYTMAATKTGSAANLEAVFAQTADAGKTASWLMDTAAAYGYQSGNEFAGDLIGNTDGLRDYAEAAASAAELHFSNAVTKTYSEDDLIGGKALFIAGTTSFADNLKTATDAADRLLLIPFKIPHTAAGAPGTGTTSGTASGSAAASGATSGKTNTSGATASGKANTSGTAAASGTASGKANTSGSGTTSGTASGNGNTTGNAAATPKTPVELDRSITVCVLSWFVINPNADAAKITEAENFLKWLYTNNAGIASLTGAIGTDWAALTGTGTTGGAGTTSGNAATSGNGAAGTSKAATSTAGTSKAGTAGETASGGAANSASSAKAAASTAGTSKANTANSAAAASGASKAATSGAAASGSGAANSAATSGNGNDNPAKQLPDSLRKSLAAYLKAGDWVPSYYRYASEGWRTNFESAATSYAQGKSFTEETRTGFVTGIFSDWGGKDTNSPLEQSMDQSAQGGGQTASKAGASSKA